MKKIVFILSLILSIPTLAESWHESEIDRLHVTSEKILIVYLKRPNPHCSNSTSIALKDSSSAGADWIYSALLMYKATGASLHFASAPNNLYGCEFTKIEG